MSSIQEMINSAANELNEAYGQQKASKKSLKELKKALTEKLAESAHYQDLSKREQEIKKIRKDLTEELQEIKKEKEQMAMETEEQKEMDDFIEQQDTKFSKIKDRVIVNLSRQLADQGVIAEIHYKNGQLILIVARA